MDYNPWDHKELDGTEQLSLFYMVNLHLMFAPMTSLCIYYCHFLTTTSTSKQTDCHLLVAIFCSCLDAK